MPHVIISIRWAIRHRLTGGRSNADLFRIYESRQTTLKHDVKQSARSSHVYCHAGVDLSCKRHLHLNQSTDHHLQHPIAASQHARTALFLMYTRTHPLPDPIHPSFIPTTYHALHNRPPRPLHPALDLLRNYDRMFPGPRYPS
jgi:hypothetical protein